MTVSNEEVTELPTFPVLWRELPDPTFAESSAPPTIDANDSQLLHEDRPNASISPRKFGILRLSIKTIYE